VTATGHMDLTRPAVVPVEFFDTPISRVVLRLRPDYRYGDTTATVTFDIHEILESWNAPSLVSDTTLAVRGEVVTSFSVSAADTLVHVEMPVTWVEDRSPLLRAADFNAAFHGFQIRPRDDSRLALGFDGARSDLLVVSGVGESADSVSYFTSALFSSVTRDVPPEGTLPQGLIPLQDGPSQGLTFGLRLDTLGAPALSAGFLRIEADTTLLVQNRPAGFVRPMSRTLVLYGIGSGAPIQLGEGVFDTRRQGYVFSSTFLTGVFQDAALGRPLFERYAVGFPRSPSTLNVAPLVSTPAAPVRAVLLLVPGTD
jgi:hypothetical protein